MAKADNNHERISRRDMLGRRLFGKIAEMMADRVTDRLDAVERAASSMNSTAAHSTPSPYDSSGAEGLDWKAPPRRARPVHRPPGAVDEATFLAQCTRCNECITACPPNALFQAPADYGPAAGTPVIDVARAPCVMCDDPPCIAACEPAVLRTTQPLKMGAAHINPFDCLAHNGSICTECSDKCPVPGAIAISQERPAIIAEICTGCGVCFDVCPAPSNAVVIIPLLDRPKRCQEP